MRRLQGALVALATFLLAGPAAAAEITRVTSSGEPDAPFAMDVGVRWERTQTRATLVREGPSTSSTLPLGATGGRDRLRYTRTRNAIVPRLSIGLYRDLELHAELPYVLEDDQTYRYGDGWDAVGAASPSIADNDVDADGQPAGGCSPGPCPLFAANPMQTVFHGGRAGDLEVGLAWAIFNDRKDDTKATWVVAVDVTAPTSPAYDPALGRTAARWVSPFSGPDAKAGPLGQGIWKWDFSTTLSRRHGALDPYVKVHHTRMFKSSKTYSNCDHAREATDLSKTGAVRQMNSAAVENCKSWGSEADAILPWVLGVVVGTEIIPYDEPVEGQRLTLDLRVRGDYTTKQRFFNELTDATGKLHMTGEYIELEGMAGLYLTASRYVQFQGTAAYITRTAHYLTGESLGRDGAWPAVNPATGRPVDEKLMNPNFDWRYDAPGQRFRLSSIGIFELNVSAVLRF